MPDPQNSVQIPEVTQPLIMVQAGDDLEVCGPDGC